MTCRNRNGSPTMKSGMAGSILYMRSSLFCEALTASVLSTPNTAVLIEYVISSIVMRPASTANTGENSMGQSAVKHISPQAQSARETAHSSRCREYHQ